MVAIVCSGAKGRGIACAATHTRRVTLALGFALAAAFVSPESARGEPEFPTVGERWNGLGRFIELAEEESVSLRITAELDASSLSPSDAVVLLHVEPSRSVSRLASFVEGGGALVIADESEAVTPLLSRLAFERFDDVGDRASAVPGREGLYVAAPLVSHPIVEGVDWLVTNLPRPFHHDALVPLVALDEDHHLLAIGRLGEGELVALGDSSVFIDQMLALSGNERFARNLLRWLRSRSVVHVVVGPGRVFGAPSGASRSGIDELRDAFSRVASIHSPPAALYLAATIALAGLVLFLAAKLARASAFQGPRALVLPGEEGGVAGRVAFHRAHSSNLRGPALVYRRTLYEALSIMLDAEVKTRDQAASRLGALGCAPSVLEEARGLLEELDRIHGADGAVSSRRFRRLVSRGERVLEGLTAATERHAEGPR